MYRRNFSRGELAVLAVGIALVMLATFPGIISALDADQRVICTSNMRQITFALTMYSRDYGGLLPSSVLTDDEHPNKPVLHEQLKYYVADRAFSCPRGWIFRPFPGAYILYGKSGSARLSQILASPSGSRSQFAIGEDFENHTTDRMVKSDPLDPYCEGKIISTCYDGHLVFRYTELTFSFPPPPPNGWIQRRIARLSNRHG